jgi:hypothetical protein
MRCANSILSPSFFLSFLYLLLYPRYANPILIFLSFLFFLIQTLRNPYGSTKAGSNNNGFHSERYSQLE